MVVMASVGYPHGNVIRQRICGLVQSAGYLILNTVSAVGLPSLVSRCAGAVTAHPSRGRVEKVN